MPRVRQKGHRRRITNSTLVRTRPAVGHDVPPIPLSGRIYRAVYGEAISDYASLSTASWSAGTTGVSGSPPVPAQFNANCLYHHYTTTDRRTTPVSAILQPIRWRISVPTTDGGTYDNWLQSIDNTGFGFVTLTDGRYQHTQKDAFGRAIAPVHTLLVSGSHAEFQDGFAQLDSFPMPVVMGYISGAVLVPPNLAAISALPYWDSAYVQVYAARHWVNGVATSAVNTDCQSLASPFWKVNVAEGDEYYLDVWYLIGSLAVRNQTGPGKQCFYIPTTLVSNGSRMIRMQISSPVRWLPEFVFSNVNFTPAYNYTEQTYQITIAGHSGWTLKGGTNGPHKMITADGWTASIGAESITWTAPGSHTHVKKIVLRWTTEIVYLEVYPNASLGVQAGPIIYKPTNDGTYRTSTTSTEFGLVNHAPMGRFAQSGTTTFDVVGWSTLAYTNANMDGFDGLVMLAGAIPTSITVTRTTR
mgnify:CR=1 FL=1|tara:strand:- start:508 stop:1920 length:1413 start_codon:yes stop_codon:yes gene_type:complete